jgi:hypothetical protein
MPITGTIKGLNYAKITTAGAEEWVIDPTDQNGNIVSEMTIECVTTAGTLQLDLPAISTFNNFWNTKITIIANTATPNDVTVKAFNSAVPPLIETNTIGSAASVVLGTNFMAVELNVASSTVWYGVKTA